MSDGEFRFTLEERRDKRGDLYLFAGLRFLNSVLFVRQEPAMSGRPRKWLAVLKPYKPKGEDYDPSEWNDDAHPTHNATRNNP